MKSKSYNDSVKKFKPKKTTDDCYTPAPVYDAVAWWVEKEYNIDRSKFVRPFYPGGDYKGFDYPEGCAVVDNPPFSILSEILDFYQSSNIKYFLFAPALTLLSNKSTNGTVFPVGVDVTYSNGAVVHTSFCTNLDDPEVKVRSSPELYRVIKNANDANLRASKEKCQNTNIRTTF